MDGQPDLQRVWANNNATPLEQPKELAGREYLTNDEVAALKKKEGELFANAEGRAGSEAVNLRISHHAAGQ